MKYKFSKKLSFYHFAWYNALERRNLVQTLEDLRQEKTRIVETYILKNVYIRNLHNNYLFPRKELFLIKLSGGETRIIDWMSEHDIGSVDYYEIVKTSKTKEIRNNFKKHCIKLKCRLDAE